MSVISHFDLTRKRVLKVRSGALTQARRSPVPRIIIRPSDTLADLSDGFVRALTLLTDSGLRPRTGTMLVSKYAVIVVDDHQVLTAIELSAVREFTRLVGASLG